MPENSHSPAHNQDASTTVIVGAGFLGRRVACALEAPVVATTRTGVWTAPPHQPEHVQLDTLNICTDTESRIGEVTRGIDKLVVCVSTGRVQSRTGVYIDGVRRLLEVALSVSTLSRVVYTSSTSALPGRNGLVGDDEPEGPSSERGRVQREAEQQVARLCAAAGVPYLILRLGGLYGPGRGIGRIYRTSGRTSGNPLAGNGAQATNLIHVDDATTCVCAALAMPATRSGAINVCADDHRSRREMYALAAKHRGDPPPQWEQPEAPTTGKRVDNRRMKDWLGVELAYPMHHVGDE